MDPGAFEIVAWPQPILGSVSDPNLEYYSLEVSPRGQDLYSLLAEGSAVILDGELAFWSSMPPDAEYDLRLTASDVAGNSTSSLSPVLVDTTPPERPPTCRGWGSNPATSDSRGLQARSPILPAITSIETVNA